MKKIREITKQQAQAIRKKFPDVEVVSTSKKKKHRGKYYVPEYSKVVKFLSTQNN